MENKTDLEIFQQANENVLKRLAKESKFKNYIILTLIVTNLLIAGLFIAKDIYIMSNFEVEVSDEINYEQQTDGNSNIINGNQYKDNSTHNQ